MVVNTKHPEANSRLIESVLKGISPDLRDIRWLESDDENLILEVNLDPNATLPTGGKEAADSRERARQLQNEVMERLHMGPSPQS